MQFNDNFDEKSIDRILWFLWFRYSNLKLQSFAILWYIIEFYTKIRNHFRFYLKLVFWKLINMRGQKNFILRALFCIYIFIMALRFSHIHGSQYLWPQHKNFIRNHLHKKIPIKACNFGEGCNPKTTLCVRHWLKSQNIFPEVQHSFVWFYDNSIVLTSTGVESLLERLSFK